MRLTDLTRLVWFDRDELLATLGQQIIDYQMEESYLSGWNLEGLEAETREGGEEDETSDGEEESNEEEEVDSDDESESESGKRLRVGTEGLTIS